MIYICMYAWLYIDNLWRFQIAIALEPKRDKTNTSSLISRNWKLAFCNSHFRVYLSVSIKARPGAQPFIWTLICMWMKSHFHIKGWAPRLALRKKFKDIRKWRISFKWAGDSLKIYPANVPSVIVCPVYKPMIAHDCKNASVCDLFTCWAVSQ